MPSEFPLTILFCTKCLHRHHVLHGYDPLLWTIHAGRHHGSTFPLYNQGQPLISHADPNVPPQTIHPLALEIPKRRRLPLHILHHPPPVPRIHDHILRHPTPTSLSILPLRPGNRPRTTPHAHPRARVAERPRVPAAPIVVPRRAAGVRASSRDREEDCCEGGAGCGAAADGGDLSVTAGRLWM